MLHLHPVESRSPGLATDELAEPWLSLLTLFRQSDTLPLNTFSARIRDLRLETELASALIQAAEGDNRPMNAWLFSRPPSYSDPLPWLAPVAVGKARRYAWMIGYQSPLSVDVRERFAVADRAATNDALLHRRMAPPPLLFVEPIEVASVIGKKGHDSPDQDHFAIFQTNYKSSARSETSDLDQRFAINVKYLVAYRQKAFARASSLLGPEGDLGITPEDVALVSLVHTEGHNRGHFLGPWPLGPEKKCLLYEALEEYRACVSAIRLAEYADLTSAQLNALAVSVFAVRFFGYGFDAYCLPKQRRRTVREITVGLMFFQTLLAHGAIHVHSDAHVWLELDPAAVRRVLISSLADIHEAEDAAIKKGRCVDSLRDLARSWYGVAFPNGCYSPQATAVYTRLLHKE